MSRYASTGNERTQRWWSVERRRTRSIDETSRFRSKVHLTDSFEYTENKSEISEEEVEGTTEVE